MLYLYKIKNITKIIIIIILILIKERMQGSFAHRDVCWLELLLNIDAALNLGLVGLISFPCKSNLSTPLWNILVAVVLLLVPVVVL